MTKEKEWEISRPSLGVRKICTFADRDEGNEDI
jgi:hypothetical protein